MTSNTLAQIDQAIAVRHPNVRSFLVLRDGDLIHERYFCSGGSDQRWNIMSAQKSLVSALVGVALQEGWLTGLDQRVTEILGDLRTAQADQQIERLTLRHLLTMTSGFYYPRLAADSQPIWERTQRSDHWARFSLNLPVREAMGSHFAYKNTDALLVAALLVRVTGRPIGDLLSEYLFEPLGLGSVLWQPDDPQAMGTGMAFMTAREMARVGQLYLEEGCWQGRQVLPHEWVRQSTTRQVGQYGYLWWVHQDGFAASGAGGQLLRVVPNRRMVIVIQSELSKRYRDPNQLVEELLLPSVDPLA